MDNIRECHFSKEPLTLGIIIFTPVSSVPGSSSFFFFQPLLSGKVFASVGVLIAAQLSLLLANRFFCLESLPVKKGPEIWPGQTVRMTLSDLQDFLASVSHDPQSLSSTSAPSSDSFSSSPDQAVPGIFPAVTPEIPLVVALSIGGDFTNKPFCPTITFIIPLLTFPGVRGALPLLILELLTTILVRAVVPPQTTGSKPFTDPFTNPGTDPGTDPVPKLQFSPEDLLKLLNRFNKHFGS